MEIHIQGQLVEFYDKHVQATTSLEEFKKGLINSYGIETPFFSDKCRFYKEIDGKKIVILQFDRQVRTIQYRHLKNDPHCEVKKFTISIPSCVFIWIDQECYLFFTNQRVQSKEIKLWRARFTNLWGDGRICFGDLKTKSNLTIFDMEKLCEEFFLSEFNSDLNDHEYDYKVWDTKTKKDENMYQEFFNNAYRNSLHDFLNSQGC